MIWALVDENHEQSVTIMYLFAMLLGAGAVWLAVDFIRHRRWDRRSQYKDRV